MNLKLDSQIYLSKVVVGWDEEEEEEGFRIEVTRSRVYMKAAAED